MKNRMLLRTNQCAVTHFNVCELFVLDQSAERAIKSFAVTGIYTLRRMFILMKIFLHYDDNVAQEQALADLNRKNKE